MAVEYDPPDGAEPEPKNLKYLGLVPSRSSPVPFYTRALLYMKLSSPRKTRGFTLVELMISTAIGCAFCAAAVWFLVEGTRISLKTASSSTNDLAEWGIFSALTIDSKVANGMFMYPDFAKATISNPANELDDQSTDRKTGNVMILTKSSYSPGTETTFIERVTGYVFSPSQGALKSFTFITTDAERGATVTLEAILENHFDTITTTTIATNLAANSFGTTGKAFLCRSKKNRSAVLNLEISNGFANVSTAKSKLIEATIFVRG